MNVVTGLRQEISKIITVTQFGDCESLETEVHVWCVELSASRAIIEDTVSILADSERQRASQFSSQDLADRFILGRGVLRVLLSGYVGISPDRLKFEYGPQGKPRLTVPNTRLEFNLSHSGNLAAYAFTVGRELGVDIERIRPTRDCDAIARRFFSETERLDLLSLPEADREAAFYRCWVRKEAYIKACGGGLSIPLDSFRVSLKPGEAAALLETRGSVAEAQEWAMHDFDVAPEFDGAVALRDRTRVVQVHNRMSAETLLSTNRKFGSDVSLQSRI